MAKDPEKDRTGPRSGGSRTYDKEGNLIEVDGKPVKKTAPRKPPSTGGDE